MVTAFEIIKPLIIIKPLKLFLRFLFCLLRMRVRCSSINVNEVNREKLNRVLCF